MPRRRRRATRPSTTGDLPPCPGPKLHAFKHHDAPIQWLDQLDEDRLASSDSETQSCVFRVRIESQTYALKVFKVLDPSIDHEFWGPYLALHPTKDQLRLGKNGLLLLGPMVRPTLHMGDLSGPCTFHVFLTFSPAAVTVTYHTDPFYAECRAYGRIKEAQEKGLLKRQIAVPCHGFLLLKQSDKSVLETRGIDLGIGTGGTTEVRAIVKDVAPEDTGVNAKTLGMILRDLRFLNKLKIYNRDIRAENFRGGKLVDFGSSWTEPHCILECFNEENAREARGEDLVMFDDMIEHEEIKTKVRATPNTDYCRKLRSWIP